MVNIIETILKEKNKVLYEKEADILIKSDELICQAYRIDDEFQRNLALANIYYLKTLYDLELDNATMACGFFEKIPFEYFTEELIRDYITCLKLSYQFKKVLNILLELINVPQSFEFQYYCLRQLVDDAMVADGILTKEEYLAHKENLLKLLSKEQRTIEITIP